MPKLLPNVSGALDELFATPDGPRADEDAVLIELDRIDPNPFQPRLHFDEAEMRELADSLEQHGQLQACLVRPHPDEEGRFQLVAGERRLRAAKLAGLERLRCVVRDVDDEGALVLALEENLRRRDNSVMERARSLDRLRALLSGGEQSVSPGKRVDAEASLSVIGERVRLSKASVHRLLALLELPEDVQGRFEKLGLNEKHGRGLVLLQGRDEQGALLSRIEDEELSGNRALSLAEGMVNPKSSTLEEGAEDGFSPGNDATSNGAGAGHKDGGSASTPSVEKVLASPLRATQKAVETLRHAVLGVGERALLQGQIQALKELVEQLEEVAG
jgi:ParB family chromosome partitioning protein